MAKKKAGRNPKLTEDLISRVCGQIKKGNTIRTACVASGIGETTFFDWKRRGEADRTGKPADGDTPAVPAKRTIYVQFVESLEHADAVAQQRLLARVVGMGGWKGAMEILKRRWPKEFGDKTALTNPDGTPLAPGIGGGNVNVSINCNAPSDDNPWIDKDGNPIAGPPVDGEEPQPPKQ